MYENGKWSKKVFARNLKHYMDRAGMNQKEMAKIAGVSAPAFSDWINAIKYPRIDKIEILANYFGIAKSDLIEDKTNNTTDKQPLTEGEAKLLELFRQSPVENRQMIIEMVQVASKKN